LDISGIDVRVLMESAGLIATFPAGDVQEDNIKIPNPSDDQGFYFVQ
jgi:hypothetical protein